MARREGSPRTLRTWLMIRSSAVVSSAMTTATGTKRTADLTVIEHVQQHGWRVVMVSEDEIGPGFAYTIGLAHTHGGFELAMFGLDIHAVHRVLNTLGGKSAAGRSTGRRSEPS